MRTLVLIAALVLLACGPLSAAGPDELLTIRVAGGREFTGRKLARSDDARLWLRVAESGESGGLTIDRPIAWTQITDARAGVRAISLDELRGEPPAMSAPAANMLKKVSGTLDVQAPQAVLSVPESSRHLFQQAVAAGEAPPARAADSVFFAPLRAVDVATEVWLENWDRDQEVDGLGVLVSPIAHDGRVFPALLTVEAEIYVPRHYNFSLRPTTAGWAVERIARCQSVVRADQFGPRGALVRLPFRWPHPEFDTSLSRYALVKLRIGVPGSGVFERTFDGVRLRPWSPTRDLAEQFTGFRYLPGEQRPVGQ